MAHDIYVYRFSSKLIPLATWKEFSWDYTNLLKPEFEKIGNYVKEHEIRVSAHPDHFSVMNTPNDSIFASTIEDLQYHDQFLTAMGLDERYKLVVHVGGVYGDKEVGKCNFMKRFRQLPKSVQARITLENDDKSYTLKDVLEINRKLHIPIVLDVHHFMVHHKEGEKLELKKVFATWKEEYFPPKIHFSSPKSIQERRAHADYIKKEEFKEFFLRANKVGQDFDVMLEAKAKDLAVLKLRKELKTFFIKRK